MSKLYLQEVLAKIKIRDLETREITTRSVPVNTVGVRHIGSLPAVQYATVTVKVKLAGSGKANFSEKQIAEKIVELLSEIEI